VDSCLQINDTVIDYSHRELRIVGSRSQLEN
jgi:hypothetical protein